MNLLASQKLNDLLAELSEANAPAGELGLGGNQPENVPADRVAVHAQDQIRSAEMEERQSMGLDDLAQVHEPPQLVRRRRYRHREDRIAGFGRGKQMADRTDP